MPNGHFLFLRKPFGRRGEVRVRQRLQGTASNNSAEINAAPRTGSYLVAFPLFKAAVCAELGATFSSLNVFPFGTDPFPSLPRGIFLGPS